jgi:hypothetical protein
MSLPGVRTTSKTSQVTRPAASGARPTTSQYLPGPSSEPSRTAACRRPMLLWRRFARLAQSKVQFSKVPRRTATSIILLTVWLAGITPTGFCALMCERHAPPESRHHCSGPSNKMPGMAHDRSAMDHLSVEAVSAMSVSQSCRTSCATTERLNVWRKVVPQVTVVRSRAVVLSKTIEFLAPNCIAVWGLDSGPPARQRVRATSFSILRI